MFGINEIIFKIINNKHLKTEEKFKLLHSKKVSKTVIKYLISKLHNIYITINNEYEGTVMNLMHDKMLEGWCWQTTESIIIFFNDTDYIERGNLTFDESEPLYSHSWICFTFDNTEYVFDPCLDLICKKEDYYKVFKIDCLASVTKNEVKNAFLKEIQNSTKKEIQVTETKGVNSPLFRNNSTYSITSTDGQIQKIIAHFN